MTAPGVVPDEPADRQQPAAGIGQQPAVERAAEVSGWARYAPTGIPELPAAAWSSDHDPADPLPGALRVVGRGLDLNVGGSGSIRRASLYAGMMFLLLLGPIAVVVALVASRLDRGLLDRMLHGQMVPLGFDLGAAPIVLLVGGLALAAVSVDLQNVAVLLIDGQASGRRTSLARVLGQARRGFWRLIGASLASGVLLLLPSLALALIIGQPRAAEPQVKTLVRSLFGLVAATPFAYVGASVVLGRAGPLEALRWSWRLARRRWRLAVVLGVVNTATGYLAAFGFGAGADVLVRVADGLGLAADTNPLKIVELAVIVAFAIAALGSLVMTIAALSVGPQVVAYRALGGPLRDGDPLATTAPNEGRPSASASPPAALISRGIWVALGILAVSTLVTIWRLA
ncbi:MAG: hypothetical protein NVS9B8_09380 [Candidatus Limnocylindrales bacterium]